MPEGIEIIRKFNGGMRFRSNLFRDQQSWRYRKFLDELFEVKGIEAVDTSPVTKTMRILYQPQQIKEKALLNRITQALKEVKGSPGRETKFIHAAISKGQVRSLKRYGEIITGWQIKHAFPGRLRIQHHLLFRKKEGLNYVQERLLKVPGVDKVKTNPNTQSILILYQPEKINQERLLAIAHLALTEALAGIKKKDHFDIQQPLAITSLGMAAIGNYFAPWLLPLNGTLVFYSAKPTFDQAKHNILKKRKFGLEVLDSMVLLGCLATGQVFAASLMSFLVCMGRKMLNKPSEESKRFLSRVIYKVPRFAWLVKGKTKIEVCIDDLKEGDKIVLEKGDIVPVDGIVVKGTAIIDERYLTGSISATLKKKKEDEVFASSRVLSGKIYLAVKKPASQSVIAQLKEAVFQTTSHKVKAQRIGEKVQEHAVLPTLGASFIGYSLGGFDSAMAVVTADYGTSIKITAPMGFLATLGLATKQGIFIKDGHAFERLAHVDTVIFKNRESLLKKDWEVKEIFKLNGISKEEILGYAAAGTATFYNPLTKALQDEAKALKISLPQVFRANGATLTLDGLDLTVGNYLLLEAKEIEIPTIVKNRVHYLKTQGKELILVALDKYLVGGIELGENGKFLATGIIQDLKKKGIREMYFVAEDKVDIDKTLAQSLGIENYYAGISSREEIRLINRLHRRDRKVAVVSHQDYRYSPRPEVSICLNGLGDIAKSNADIILRKDDFLKLPLAWEISRHLRRKTQATLGLIAIPNSICIAGAMFGVIGFVPSLLLNSSCNFVATLSNSIPLYRTYEEELQEEYAQNKI